MLKKIYFFVFLWYSLIKVFIAKFLLIQKIEVLPDSILFLENFPINNSGYQYRAKKWAERLNKNGFKCEVCTLIEDKADFDQIFKDKTQIDFFIKSIRLRFKQCVYARKFETVIVRRELVFQNDYGNLFMDKFLLKIHPNVILDFDDDISAAKQQPRKITNLYGRLLLEDGNKFNNTLRLYKRFIVASNYLKKRVLQENPMLPPENIVVIPTCVDYDKYPPKHYPVTIEKITFGWVGGDHNYPLLDTLLPVLNQLAKKYQFKLLVIGGTEYKRDVSFEIEFAPWSMDTEVENLYRIDVGLMPLEDDLRGRGKGGFKLIQYMGLGIVSVASAVTINCEIVNHGVDSFLAHSLNDWKTILEMILEKKIDFQQVGKKAREKIEKHYTFVANKEKYLNFISQIEKRRECAE